MKKIIIILMVMALLANYAMADNKSITLNNNKLADVEYFQNTLGLGRREWSKNNRREGYKQPIKGAVERESETHPAFS